jgi:hypothetical protein
VVAIVSTPAARQSVETELRNALPVSHWLIPDAIPYRETQLLSLLGRSGIAGGSIILLVRYGRRNPSDFPAICTGPYVISLVFYNKLEDLHNWAAAVRKYDNNPPPKALALAMMKPLYMKWGEAIFQSLRKNRYHSGRASRHFADKITNVDLGRKLSRGSPLAVYVGHGRSRGWSGYRGFRWKHLALFKQKVPIGTLISLSCSSLLHDKKDSFPMGLQLIMAGRGCAFLGSCGPVQIVPLRSITKILIELFELTPVMPLGEFIAAAHVRILGLNDTDVKLNWQNFRIIGNPLQMI